MNWEHLPKNAVNNETIEQAIIRLILEHNNNATAHMGEGQSIDVHRKNEIIDHKAGSVLNDKLSFSEIEYLSYFENLSVFEIGTGVTSGAYNSLQMVPTVNNSDNCFVRSETSINGSIIDFTKDFLFQTVFMIKNNGGNVKFYTGFGYGDNDVYQGIGFVVRSGILYASFNRYTGEEDEFINESLGSFSFDTVNILRFQYIAGERKLKFIVNGIELFSYTVKNGSQEIMEEYLYDTKFVKNTNESVVAYITSIFWSRSV
jgi:hypothetical protein